MSWSTEGGEQDAIQVSLPRSSAETIVKMSPSGRWSRLWRYGWSPWLASMAAIVAAAIVLTSPSTGPQPRSSCQRLAGPHLTHLEKMSAWHTTAAAPDWSPGISVGRLVANHNPWGFREMQAGDEMLTELYASRDRSSVRLRVQAGPLPTRSGLPKGAPYLLVGSHYKDVSAENPFVTDGVPGRWTDTIRELEASTAGTMIAKDDDARYIIALQTYLYFEPYTGDALDGKPYLDVQIAIGSQGVTVCCYVTSHEISGHRVDIYRTGIGPYADNFYILRVIDPAERGIDIDMRQVIEVVRALHNEKTGRTDRRYWMRSVSAWIEPIAGRLDYVIDGLQVRVDGEQFGSLTCG